MNFCLENEGWESRYFGEVFWVLFEVIVCVFYEFIVVGFWF